MTLTGGSITRLTFVILAVFVPISHAFLLPQGYPFSVPESEYDYHDHPNEVDTEVDYFPLEWKDEVEYFPSLTEEKMKHPPTMPESEVTFFGLQQSGEESHVDTHNNASPVTMETAKSDQKLTKENKDASQEVICSSGSSAPASKEQISSLPQVEPPSSSSNNSSHILSTNLSNTPRPKPTCPSGWSKFSSSCFFLTKNRTTWTSAHHACASLDPRARLASIHHDTIFHINILAFEGGRKNTWIGLARTEDSWGWSDGTEVDFENWDKGQPNGEKKGQDCVHLGGKFRRWHDNWCDRKMKAMCEIKLE